MKGYCLRMRGGREEFRCGSQIIGPVIAMYMNVQTVARGACGDSERLVIARLSFEHLVCNSGPNFKGDKGKVTVRAFIG